MDSGYQQQPVGSGRVLFTITPAPAPSPTGLPILIAGAAGLTAFLAFPRPGMSSLVVHLAAAIAVGTWCHIMTSRWLTRRMDRARVPGGTFVASPLSLESDHDCIPAERIERLIVRNAIPGIAEAGVSGPAALEREPHAPSPDPTVRESRRAAISYMLCVKHRNGVTTLAGGMTAVTAHGLLADVIRVMGLDRRRGAEPARQSLPAIESAPSASAEAPAHR
jgi:hypothetical protein